MHTTAPVRIALIVAALLVTTACGFAEEPLAAQFDFEQQQLSAAWSSTACGAELAITREPADVRGGRGALEFAWDATDGRLAILTVEPIALDDRARSLRLSVKLSERGPVMYGVEEKDGAVYQGYLHTPGGVWHDVAVDLDELMLSENSQDPNGRLDVHEINGIMVADLSNLNGEAGRSLGIKEGRQRMWLDEVALSSELAPHRSSRGPNGGTIIDDFERKPILALPIGGPTLTLVDGPGEGDASAVRVEYAAGGYRWAGLVSAVGYLDLTDESRICVTLRAEQAAPLHVVLEERDGTKYMARHRLDPQKGWYEMCLPFAEFELDQQTTDENDRLDLDQLRVIIPVVDTRRAEFDEGRGVWEISRVRAE
jgi:hypothetical protein